MGIRVKILLCLLAVLGPMLGMGAFARVLFDSQIEERARTALSTIHRLEFARINDILEGYIRSASKLSDDEQLREFVLSTQGYGSDAHSMTPVAKAYSDNDSHDDHPSVTIDTAADWPLQQLTMAIQRKASLIDSSIVEVQIVNRLGHIMGQSVGFSWLPDEPELIQRSMQHNQTLVGNAFPDISGKGRLGHCLSN